jgi:hypothetical protein
MKERRIFCLFKNEWGPVAGTCEHWVEYSSNMNKEDRVTYALEARARLDSKEGAKRRRKEQVWLVVLGAVLGAILTIAVQWVLKQLGLK